MVASLNREQIAALPEELVTRFKEALTTTEMDLIESIIQEIHQCQPQLGKDLAILADDFEYQKILRLLP